MWFCHESICEDKNSMGRGNHWACPPPRPPPRLLSEGIKEPPIFSTECLGKASWKHLTITVFTAQFQDGQWRWNGFTRKSCSCTPAHSERRNTRSACLFHPPPGLKDNLNSAFHLLPQKGKTNIWLEYCIYIYKKETTVFRDLLFFPSEAQNIPPC